MRLVDIIAGLNRAGVDYVVVGGVAANAHGSPRITADVDICYDPSPSNRERLAAVLTNWHAYLRGVEPGLPWVMDARALRDSPVITMVTDLGALDVMDRVAGVGEYPAVLRASVELTVMGATLRVLALDALIAAKKAAGRRKDIEALLELEVIREERKKRAL